jgi:hypothetical protein
VSPVKYELGFYIPEGGILHSDRSENLKSYISPLVKVYEESVMNEWNVLKRCHLFIRGRSDEHNKARSRHLSVITKDMRWG